MNIAEIVDWVMTQPNPVDTIEELKSALHERSPRNVHPVNFIRWMNIDKVQANDYNPNSVASVEMKLLHTSISHDGYTQPVVTVYDPEIDKYVIVDGFHRYFTMRSNKDIWDTTGGFLPIVVLNKEINDRMASTVRHNRARGKHSVSGMANMAFKMMDNGWDDAAICNELGMEPEELLRLKHITGFSKLFADAKYKREWVTRKQIMCKQKYDGEPTPT